MTRFALAPFPGDPAPAGVRIAGDVAREGAVLALTWRLHDPDGVAAVPPPAPPERRYGLWEATCFEFFVRDPAGPGYWEFNLAPEGHWNVYRLDAYREGLRDEPAFARLPFAVTQTPGGLEVALRVDLAPLGLAEAPWRLAIAAVVAAGAGTSYWALAHPAAEADFHAPGAFTLDL